MPTTEAKSRIPDSYTRDKPKKKKKKSSSKSSERGGVDLGAIFGGPQGFLNKGLESNWGQRKVPKEKQSDLDWIQQHGPVGDTKADGTKATRPEIVRANQNDLNRRNTPDLGLAQAAVQEKKAEQEMQAGQPGITKGDEAFRVAFGLPGTKESGQPVGYATKPGGSVPVHDPRVLKNDPASNIRGDFTEPERGQIRQRVAEAPNALAQLGSPALQTPMSPQGQMAMLPGGKPFDLNAVFPPKAAAPTALPAPASAAPIPGVQAPPVAGTLQTADEEQIRRFGKPYSRAAFDQSPAGKFWDFMFGPPR